jgi:hypothetical protein
MNRPWRKRDRPSPGAGVTRAKPPARANTPAPGTTPAAGRASGPPVSQAAAPLPGFTPRELRVLAKVDEWAGECGPVRRGNASVLADLFRQKFPHLCDDDLGRMVLVASDIARDYGLAGTTGRLPGTLALTAAALTRLTRTDVPVGSEDPCPDCEAPPMRLCHHWCPRYAEDPGDHPAETEDNDE